MTAESRAPIVLRADPLDETALRLELFWSRDRYRHRLLVGPLEQSACLLESSDESWDHDWPSSPPLQQLSIEERETGRVALLVGMAGKSHWSASIELLTHPTTVRFDIACLAKPVPQRVGSRYFAKLPIDSVQSTRIDWSLDHRRYRLQIDDGTTAPSLARENDHISIVPPPSHSKEKSQTICWSYEVVLDR